MTRFEQLRGTPETIFEGHVKSDILVRFVRDKIHMKPKQRKEVDQHLEACNMCQSTVIALAEREQSDNKTKQIPVHDR